MISINTKRLHLRNLAQNDADVMFDYRNNEICARYQRGQTKDFEGIVNLIERRKNDEISMISPCMISVALKETNEMIGEIVVMPKDNTFSLGYTFSYKYHRQGYAFEALTVLIEYLHTMAPEWEFIRTYPVWSCLKNWDIRILAMFQAWTRRHSASGLRRLQMKNLFR